MSFVLGKIIKFLSEESSIYLERTDKKPLRQQMAELLALKRYYGYVPYQYIKHGLYLKSRDGDIFDFIPPEIVHRFRDGINPKYARQKVIDKKKFSQIMIENNLPGIVHLFTLHRSGVIRGRNEKEVSFSQFTEDVSVSRNGNFFVKPVNGGSGSGIYRLVVRDRGLEINGRQIVNEDEFHKTLFLNCAYDEFIVQREINQHELLNRLNPSSVNTIRIDTFVQGEYVVSNAALLRMSNGYSYTDNWAKGGIIVNIDLDTGVLGEVGRTKAKYGSLEVRHHPVSNIRFGGIQIPFWSELKQFVRYAALALQPLKFLGWDVAIGVDGPILIEANHDFDVFMSQEAAKGLRKTPVGKEILDSLSHTG
jgi:hypothetical protein